MKTLLLTALLSTAKPDTIPYIRHGYYEADTLNTEAELRLQHYKDTQQMKAAKRQSFAVFLIGVLIGGMLGFGIGGMSK